MIANCYRLHSCTANLRSHFKGLKKREDVLIRVSRSFIGQSGNKWPCGRKFTTKNSGGNNKKVKNFYFEVKTPRLLTLLSLVIKGGGVL